jgi:hypothetical protein
MTAYYQETGRSDFNFDKYGEYDEGEWIEKWLNRCVALSLYFSCLPCSFMGKG